MKKQSVRGVAGNAPTTQEFKTNLGQFPNKDRVGVYLASFSGGREFFRYWDGKNFHYGAGSVQQAFNFRGKIWPRKTNLYWLGLADEPCKVAP